MLLLANGVGFFDPAFEVVIHFIFRLKAKVMQVIARGEGLDFVKARVLAALGEDESAEKVGLARIERHKAHTHLKRHACLLRDDRHRPARLHHLGKLFIDAENLWLTAGKQLFQAEFSARMPLVCGGEFLAAFGALPEWSRRGNVFAGRRFFLHAKLNDSKNYRGDAEHAEKNSFIATVKKPSFWSGQTHRLVDGRNKRRLPSFSDSS